MSDMSLMADMHARLRIADGINGFMQESLAIEGIHREPFSAELFASREFLLSPMTLASVLKIQAVYAPGMPLREKVGLNVKVGGYLAPPGSPDIRRRLKRLLKAELDAYCLHVDFELLHPFMDGNGRTGRIIWAHRMMRDGMNPFSITFLHRFYYQTLAHAERVPDAAQDSAA